MSADNISRGHLWEGAMLQTDRMFTRSLVKAPVSTAPLGSPVAVAAYVAAACGPSPADGHRAEMNMCNQQQSRYSPLLAAE